MVNHGAAGHYLHRPWDCESLRRADRSTRPPLDTSMSIGPSEWADYAEEPPPPLVMRQPPDLLDLIVCGLLPLVLFGVAAVLTSVGTWPMSPWKFR